MFTRENLKEKEDEQRERVISQLESDLATATLSQLIQMKRLSRLRWKLFKASKYESQGRLVINLNEILKAGTGSVY